MYYPISSPSGEKTYLPNSPVKGSVIFPPLEEGISTVYLYLTLEYQTPEGGRTERVVFRDIKLREIKKIVTLTKDETPIEGKVFETDTWRFKLFSYQIFHDRVRFSYVIENLQNEPFNFWVYWSGSYVRLAGTSHPTQLLDDQGNKYYPLRGSPQEEKTYLPNSPVKGYLVFPKLREEVETVSLYLDIRYHTPEGGKTETLIFKNIPISQR